MTREEIIDFCDMKAQLEPENEDIFKAIIKALEQETVSKESYDHEYFLRKEFELKIARLEHDKNKVLDKIRAEIESYKLSEDELSDMDEDSVKWGMKIVYDIVDKYRAETEA